MATETKSNSQGSNSALWREVIGLGLLATALAVFLAILSFSPTDAGPGSTTHNLIGPVGATIGDALLYLFGVGAFFFDAILWYLGFMLLLGRIVEWKWTEIAGQLLFVLAGAMLCHLALFEYTVLGHMPGGLIGEVSGEVLRGLFGTVGTSIIGASVLTLSLMLATDMSLGDLVRKAIGALHHFTAWLRHKWTVRRLYRERVREERQKLLHQQQVQQDEARRDAERSLQPLVEPDYDFDAERDVEAKLATKLARWLGRRHKTSPEDTADHDAPPPADAPTSSSDDDHWDLGEPLVTEPEIDDTADHDIVIRNVEPDGEDDQDVIDMAGELAPPMKLDADFGPQIVESEAQRRAKAKKEQLADDDGLLFKPQRKGNYELPPINFLNYDDNDEVQVDTEALRAMAAQIEKTLSDFKVDGQVVEICPGPVITMFEFSPAPGVKISKIARLSDDLAMGLAALSVRIVAPIPGKGVVGIEVPNPDREMVWLKEIIADEVFQDDLKMQLPMALGKGTEGEPVVADLAKMPHLLVAGATGSGKSVAVNTMICSLLYRHSPEDLRMIMVDPKMLEFNIYEKIPHLLLPVVTDPKQATVALNWAVNEMEKRYQKLADLGVRNLKGYNEKVERLTKQAELDQLDGKDDTAALRKLDIDSSGKPKHERMPFLVVVIDEFADLMMTASKDVEQAVARLAQKARAAGIHVILATQRPSTDVLTGLIKANFPTRMALRVTSKTDSRVILDANGAENLLGNGDMLFVPPGTSILKRVHGAFVSEKEIHKIVDFLREQGDPNYDESILEEEEEDEDSPLDQEWEKDEYYNDAVKIVVQSGRASISMIQRKLRVGYNRAARMVDTMERDGYVGPSDGFNPREVLIEELPAACQ